MYFYEMLVNGKLSKFLESCDINPYIFGELYYYNIVFWRVVIYTHIFWRVVLL